MSKSYKFKQVNESGEGIIRLGNHSYKGSWELNGLQKIIETKCLDGTVGQVAGLMDYITVNICFHEFPLEDNPPEPDTQTTLMLDSKSSHEMWVIGYGEYNGSLTCELSNRPPN